jgi:hypothetical protein
VLVNDDKTRSFLALRLEEGEQQFNQVLRCVDQCLLRFGLPTYYEVRLCIEQIMTTENLFSLLLSLCLLPMARDVLRTCSLSAVVLAS